MTHVPPSEAELREWRGLRSLPHPGPAALHTVYGIAFPVLLDQYDDLQARVQALQARVKALESALVPVAAFALPAVMEPHPCSVRCWRVGGPCETPGGVCVECGRRARRVDERADVHLTHGELRAAAAAIGKAP